MEEKILQKQKRLLKQGLILTKFGEPDKEFIHIVSNIIRKLESNNLISHEQSEKFIDSINEDFFRLKGREPNENFIKYIFPFSIGELLTEEKVLLFYKLKHESQAELKNGGYNNYQLYSAIEYDIQEKELKMYIRLLKNLLLMGFHLSNGISLFAFMLKQMDIRKF